MEEVGHGEADSGRGPRRRRGARSGRLRQRQLQRQLGRGGGGGKTLIVSTDLPLQGSNKDASDSTNQAIELYLKSIGNKVGDYNIQLQKYDDSTAAAAKWDQAQCQTNAQKHANNANEVAVMGTLNSGCAKIEVPVLNQAPNGPLLMVSHANTNVGLTRPWDAGEPNKYYPSGKRNYARVVTHRRRPGRGRRHLRRARPSA